MIKKNSQTLEQYASRFGGDVDKWDADQWRTVATELAQRIDLLEAPSTSKRGRPLSAGRIRSENTNYEALAWQVRQRMSEGEFKQINQAVKAIMLESWQHHKDSTPGYDKRQGIVESKLKTTYTEVRKILKVWEAKAEKK